MKKLNQMKKWKNFMITKTIWKKHRKTFGKNKMKMNKKILKDLKKTKNQNLEYNLIIF